MEIPGLGEIDEKDIRSVAGSRLRRRHRKAIQISTLGLLPTIIVCIFGACFIHYLPLQWVLGILGWLVLSLYMCVPYVYMERYKGNLVKKWEESDG